MKPLKALMFVLALAPLSAAQADEDSASCTLTVVNALPAEGGIDPALSSLKPFLQAAQFKSWKSFKLVSQDAQTLKAGASAPYAAPNGTVTATYTSHSTNDAGKHRLKGAFELKTKKSSPRIVFTVDEGQPFLFAGEEHNGGILIYALSCKSTK